MRPDPSTRARALSSRHNTRLCSRSDYIPGTRARALSIHTDYVEIVVMLALNFVCAYIVCVNIIPRHTPCWVSYNMNLCRSRGNYNMAIDIPSSSATFRPSWLTVGTWSLSPIVTYIRGYMACAVSNPGCT